MRHGVWALRAVAGGAGLALLAMVAVSSAEAQWFPPIGAAPPSEIIARLRAQGLAPLGPLVRRDTVYLADVKGPAGRERLVLDAWSGAILQRFVGRGRDWRPGAAGGDVARGGEFQSPPPLAPPSKGDFLDPNNGFAYGASGGDYPVIVGPDGAHEPQRPRKAHKPAESKPTTAALPAEPMNPQSPGAVTSAPLSAPAAAAPQPAAPAAATASAPAASPPAAAPKPAAPAATMVELPVEKPAAKPAAPAQPAPSGKLKVNDVPVNPLE